MTERELLEKTIAECEILLNDLKKSALKKTWGNTRINKSALKRSRILMNEKLMNVERFLGVD